MKHSEIDFRYTMTFSQCVHGMYDEKMEAVYQKCSQNASFEEDSESTFITGQFQRFSCRNTTMILLICPLLSPVLQSQVHDESLFFLLIWE